MTVLYKPRGLDSHWRWHKPTENKMPIHYSKGWPSLDRLLVEYEPTQTFLTPKKYSWWCTWIPLHLYLARGLLTSSEPDRDLTSNARYRLIGSICIYECFSTPASQWWSLPSADWTVTGPLSDNRQLLTLWLTLIIGVCKTHAKPFVVNVTWSLSLGCNIKDLRPYLWAIVRKADYTVLSEFTCPPKQKLRY